MDEQEQLKTLYDRMYNGMIQKDTADLDEILDASFELRHMTGMYQSKDEYLSAVKGGVLNYYDVMHYSVSVRLDDTRAHIRGQSRVLTAVFGGSKNTWRLQLDIDCQKINGRWVLTKAAASAY